MHTLEEEPEKEKEAGVATFEAVDICSFEWDFKNNRPIYRQEEEIAVLEKIRMTLDSGASVNALPPNVACNYPINQDGSQVKYRSAFGQIKHDLGGKNLDVITDNGHRRRMQFRVAEVQKPLVAAEAVTNKNNMIFMDREAGVSCIVSRDLPECKQIRKLLSQIKDKILLETHNGVYTFNVHLVPKKPTCPPATPEPLAAVSKETETSKTSTVEATDDEGWQIVSGKRKATFRRQVQWP